MSLSRRQRRLLEKDKAEQMERFMLILAVLKQHDTLEKMMELYVSLKDPLPKTRQFYTSEKFQLPLDKHAMKSLRTRLEIKIAEHEKTQHTEQALGELNDIFSKSSIELAGGFSGNTEDNNRGVSEETEPTS